MGLASYYEDNQDAKDETAKAVKKELPNGGKSPRYSVLEKILMERAGSSYLTIEKWTEYVRDCYETHGESLPKGDLKTLVAKALIALDHKGHARQISYDNSSGKWKIG